jgi:hypothetical protein
MRASLVIGLVCISGVAVAAPNVSFEVVKGADGPKLVATIDGAPRAPVASITLGVAGRTVPALDVLDYAVGAEPIAIALVVNGQEVWMGNDEIEPDDAARYTGVLKNLEHSIDSLGLSSAMPVGSQVSIVSYSTGASYLVHDAPLSSLTGAALGSQRDYRNKIGTDMVQGIQLAMSDLEATRAPRKALIVIGDGNDTNNEAAAAALVELKREAAIQHIATFAIIYKSVVSADSQVISRMTQSVTTTNSTEGMGASLAMIFARLADRQYMTFDASLLPWDGQPHDVVLAVGGEPIGTDTLVLPARETSLPWWRSRWLAELALGVGLAGLFAAFTRWRATAVK